eukprot:7179854-Alexandrium_andersonii.AAC.1
MPSQGAVCGRSCSNPWTAGEAPPLSSRCRAHAPKRTGRAVGEAWPLGLLQLGMGPRLMPSQGAVCGRICSNLQTAGEL